ncbi:MAG: TIM barrel protein [Deltaproteobacteria bacterium]|nr:TIM barrel protein [Deltaproteobacteria bacterium]
MANRPGFDRRTLLAASSASAALLAQASQAHAARKAPTKKLSTYLTYAVNVEMFWKDKPFLDRLKAVGDHGLSHFEFWGHNDKDIAAIAALCAERKLTPVQFIAGWGLNGPDDRAKFLKNLPTAISKAKDLGVKMMTVVAGMNRKDVSREQQTAEVITSLKAAAEVVAKDNITLILEPLNPLVDHPGSFVFRSDHAAEIITAVNSPNIKILFDVYHQQISEGNLSGNIPKYKDLIGYFQIADHPGRHEPETGEINFGHVLSVIASVGYTGPVGLEFTPKGNAKPAIDAVLRADKAAKARATT